MVEPERREGDGIGVNLPQIVHARLTEILDPLLSLTDMEQKAGTSWDNKGI